MNNIEKIERKYVRGSERKNFLPKKIGRYSVIFENFVYDKAKILCEKYKGGFWDFIELSNGGLFLELTGYDNILLSSPNGFEKKVSAETFSVIVCLFALADFLWWLDDRGEDTQVVEDLYSFLEDYAYSLPTSSEIRSALD